MKKLFTLTKATLFFLLINLSASAQDGEAIFKSKCNSCHLVDKASTGPMLKGVLQKWTDAGEADQLVEWVQNSANLIASGKSKMANEIKGFSPMEMPAQDVKKEDVTAILTYIDNYVPKVEPTPPPSGDPSKVEITYVPNYKDNLNLFYWLLTSIVVLLIAIIVLSSSILTLAKSDYFKSKIAEREAEDKAAKNGMNTTIITIIAFFGIIMAGNQSFALTFYNPGEAALAGEDMPWLKVENIDLYFLLTINIILVIVLFYLRKMFRNLIALTKKPEELVAEQPQTLKKLYQVLSDVVPIEEEHTILMHHEYDGIRELDNNLPPWWVWMFVATIIFAVVYLFNYHVFKTSDLQIVAYEKEMKKAEREVKAYREKMSMNVDATTATLMTDPADISQGKALFEVNCVSCHEAKGQGKVGPNLTDEYWIHGNDIKDLFKTISEGVAAKGMPAHNSKFNPVQIQQVASFVLSLPYTAGNAPQGEKVEKKK